MLVDNADLAVELEPARAVDLDGWEAMVDTNIKGLVYVTRAVLPRMVARNAGHVVKFGSTAASCPYPGGNVYGAMKAFVRQFSLNSRADLIGTRVRVTEIDPGLVGGTEFSSVHFGGGDARAAGVYEGADALTPEDVADTVYWAANRPARVNINVISSCRRRRPSARSSCTAAAGIAAERNTGVRGDAEASDPRQDRRDGTDRPAEQA